MLRNGVGVSARHSSPWRSKGSPTDQLAAQRRHEVDVPGVGGRLRDRLDRRHVHARLPEDLERSRIHDVRGRLRLRSTSAFHHETSPAGVGQQPGGSEPSRTGTDDQHRNLDVALFGHVRSTPRSCPRRPGGSVR
jgi:hypothetical protein